MLKKEETLVLISLVLHEILRVETLNRWISVSERPISKIVSDSGLNKSYSSIIMDELKKLGLVEGEGQKSGMRYKIRSTVIPDVNTIARKIYEKNTEKIRLYIQTKKASGDGYPSSRASDLNPKRSSCEIDSMNSKLNKSAVVKLGALLPHLNDMRFFIIDNVICEGRVIAIEFESVDSNKIEIDLEYVKDWGGTPAYVRKSSVPLKDVFETPAAAANFLINHCVRYVKRNIKKQV